MLEKDKHYNCHHIGSQVFAIKWLTANVVHHDVDLHFQAHEFSDVNISKTVRAREKYSGMTFITVAIFYHIGPLQKLYSLTFTFIFKVKHILVMHWF